MAKRAGSGARLTTDLKGMDFPAGKDKLVAQARKNNAPNDTIEAIECLPDREYGSMADVMHGYGEVK
jgi:hypothetical protein